MYNIIKSVIETKRYELEEMLKKLDTFWIQGSLSDEEYAALVILARENALPENSYASLQNQIAALFANQAEMAKRITALENGGETPEEPAEEYPDYIQPTGAHDAYHAGDTITYNGMKYTCIAPEGVAVVWNPEVMPAYWQEVTE